MRLISVLPEGGSSGSCAGSSGARGSSSSAKPVAGGGTTAVTTSTSSAEAAVLPKAPPRVAPILPEETSDGTGVVAPAQDYWVETANSFIRYHVQPRRTLFHPGMVAEATDDVDKKQFLELMSLKPLRYTTYAWSRVAQEKVLKDKWSDAATASRSLSKE